MGDSHRSSTRSPDSFPEDPLQRLKFVLPPAHPGDLHRLRLVGEVSRGVSGKLTLLTAPAGFGKTTLLNQWAGQASQKFAYLALEKSDNDPGRFFKNFLRALRQVHPSLGKGIFELLQMQKVPSMEEALKRLTDQLGMILQDFVVVLDDYQVIDAPPVHNMVSFLIDHLPPQARLLISSESDPPFTLAELRAHGQLKEIRTPYLAFTMDEAQAFFKSVLNLEISYGDISALVVRTQGRPAALKYAGLCLAHYPTVSEFVAPFEKEERHELVFLTEMLLKKQPAKNSAFIKSLAVLERIDPGLARTLTGEPESGAILEQLNRQGAFVVSLGEEWYTIPPFLQEILYRQLREAAPEKIPELHRRAAAEYARRGAVTAAFQHALAAREFHTAGELLEEAALTMLQNGELVTVNVWLNALPLEVVQERPRLSLCRAWVLVISRQFDKVESHLRQALRVKENAPDSREIVQQVQAIREYLTRAPRN